MPGMVWKISRERPPGIQPGTKVSEQSMWLTSARGHAQRPSGRSTSTAATMPASDQARRTTEKDLAHRSGRRRRPTRAPPRPCCSRSS